MKQILTYADLLSLADAQRDHLAELRLRAETRGDPSGLVEEAEATLRRLLQAIDAFPEEEI